MIDYASIQQAYERISGKLQKTPMLYSHWLSNLYEKHIYLKLESMHQTGSFKERGALNKLLCLNEKQKKQGVVSASAGNHAQGLSYHAHTLGIPAFIFMPIHAPPIKINGVTRYHARIYLEGIDYDESVKAAKDFAKTHQLTYVHAYEDEEVMAGQGTTAIEMLEQVPNLQAVLVPVGGGGLISGMTVAFQHLKPQLRIYGVQSQALPAMCESLKKGELLKYDHGKTIADGIRVRSPGKMAFDILKQHPISFCTVEEKEIAQSIFDLFEKQKLVIEGAGACGVAGLNKQILAFKDLQTLGIVLTGGNLDPAFCRFLIEKELVNQKRLVEIQTVLEDIPGELEKLIHWVSSVKANIVHIQHERSFESNTFGQAQIKLRLDMKNKNHFEEIVALLTQKGYDIKSTL